MNQPPWQPQWQPQPQQWGPPQQHGLRPPKNPKVGALIVAGIFTLFLLASAAMSAASALRPHASTPAAEKLSDVMGLPSGSWITIRGERRPGTVRIARHRDRADRRIVIA